MFCAVKQVLFLWWMLVKQVIIFCLTHTQKVIVWMSAHCSMIKYYIFSTFYDNPNSITHCSLVIQVLPGLRWFIYQGNNVVCSSHSFTLVTTYYNTFQLLAAFALFTYGLNMEKGSYL